MEKELAEADLAGEELTAAQAEVDRLEAEIERLTEETVAAETEARDALFEQKAELTKASDHEKATKQNVNWTRFLYEEERIHHIDESTKKLVELGEELESLEQELADAVGETEKQQALLDQRQAELDAILAPRAAAEKAMGEASKRLDLVVAKLDSIAPEAMDKKAAWVLRDFPGLDFIGPDNKVHKVVPENLTVELNFDKGPRIDMCATCHMGMERPEYEGANQPHAAHPRLDLFLTAKSPHPYTEMGCTICHRGAGMALDFQRADHRPSDEAEAAQWEETYHWHKQHHWDYPMLSSEYIEASCVQCHTDSMELIADDAPRVTEGYRNFERYGCYSCHKVEWFPTKRKPGPSLKNMQAKIGPEFASAWIADPKAFRPTTWMPQIFHLENFGAEDVIVEKPNWGRDENAEPILGQEWNDTAVRAITEFLTANHPEQPLAEIPVTGDADAGREAFRVTGCLACHNLAPYDDSGEEPWDPRAPRARREREGAEPARGRDQAQGPEVALPLDPGPDELLVRDQHAGPRSGRADRGRHHRLHHGGPRRVLPRRAGGLGRGARSL